MTNRSGRATQSSLPAGIDGQKMEGTATARKPYQESEASKVLYSLSTISGRIECLQEEA